MNRFKRLTGADALTGLAITAVVTIVLDPFAGGMRGGEASTTLTMHRRSYLDDLEAGIKHRDRAAEWRAACSGANPRMKDHAHSFTAASNASRRISAVAGFSLFCSLRAALSRAKVRMIFPLQTPISRLKECAA